MMTITLIPQAPPFIVARHVRLRGTTGLAVRWRKALLAMLLGPMLLCLGQASRAADDQRAQKVVEGTAHLFASQSSTATVEMQVAKEDLQRTIAMQFWSVGDANILVRILSPSEDAGTAILKVGGKTWMYLPKANRKVEMPPSMMMTSWMGSDFTLNDLVNESRLTNDYDSATSFEGERDGVAVSEYTLTPKPTAAVVWGKITLEIRQSDEMPIWQRYYDENGTLVRELGFSEYKTVGGRLIPTRLIMRPVGQGNEQTTITYENIVFNAQIGPETFFLSNLKP
jgi:outer membrane lipoprotein-sorting protein